MNNGATINVGSPGVVIVEGSLTGHTNTTLSVGGGGSLSVTGSLSLGTGSTISSSGGSITAGACSCTGCSSACNVVLPVTLLSFKATAIDDVVHVRWSTSVETNFHYFILEKSTDGTEFFEIAHILGSGTSHARKDYFFEDVHPFVDLSYYRIAAVDFDGYRETFQENVAAVTIDTDKKFRMFPNPVSDGRITAKINFDGPPDAEVHIYNRLGVLLARYQMTSHETVIALPPLENGVYFAKLVSHQFSPVIRFAVLRN
jgi:hypothetical protein